MEEGKPRTTTDFGNRNLRQTHVVTVDVELRDRTTDEVKKEITIGGRDKEGGYTVGR